MFSALDAEAARKDLSYVSTNLNLRRFKILLLLLPPTSGGSRKVIFSVMGICQSRGGVDPNASWDGDTHRCPLPNHFASWDRNHTPLPCLTPPPSPITSLHRECSFPSPNASWDRDFSPHPPSYRSHPALSPTRNAL